MTAEEKRDQLRDRLRNLRLSTWTARKPAYLKEIYAFEHVEELLRITDKKTTADARIRILCKRVLRQRQDEHYEQNKDYGSFA